MTTSYERNIKITELAVRHILVDANKDARIYLVPIEGLFSVSSYTCIADIRADEMSTVLKFRSSIKARMNLIDMNALDSDVKQLEV